MINPYTTRLHTITTFLARHNVAIKKIVRTKGDESDPEIFFADKRVLQVGLTTLTLYGPPIHRGVLGRTVVVASGPTELTTLQSFL